MLFDYDVIVVGPGPAGIFTALEMNRLLPGKGFWLWMRAAP